MSNPSDNKEFYRDLKRTIKKVGNKKRRKQLKQYLQEHPGEAHWDEYDYGRDSTEWLNGMDKDSTRRRHMHSHDQNHQEHQGDNPPTTGE